LGGFQKVMGTFEISSTEAFDVGEEKEVVLKFEAK
jgi:hypothetical protein